MLTKGLQSVVATERTVICAFVSPQEDVVDLLPDEGSQTQELPVDPMQDGLEEVPLPGVLAVKQLQELHKIITGTNTSLL